VGTFFYAKGLGKGDAKVQYDKYLSDYLIRIKELELSLEKEQQNIKIEVVTKYVDKIRVVKEKEFVYRDKIKEVPVIRDDLPYDWLRLHNEAATRSGNSETSENSDGTAGGVGANKALDTIIHNYSTCEQNRQQLISLQKWINDTIESTNNKNR
jgi:hypothetical protein